MKKNTYYSVTVKKFSILFRHTDWFLKTQELYNDILKFYYDLYLDIFPETQPGSLETMRSLEKLTVAGRDGELVPYPLPWEKIPLYFRRAAINTAVSAARSYLSREEQRERTKIFTESVTFYKGMYKNFDENEISLKIWDGDSWRWIRCRLRGNRLPETGMMMSPALVLRRSPEDGRILRAELHIPCKTPVADGRNVKERMASGEKVCSVVFTNKDASLVCCILDSRGNMEDCLFLKGGAEYSHRCRRITEKLEKSQKSSGGGDNPRSNGKYWEKLKNLNEHYAHQFSRQVIRYCGENNAKIMVLPEYEQNHRKIIMFSAGSFTPIYLSTSVRKKLKYKAWQAGIVVLEIQQHKTSSVCSVCGGKVRIRGSEFFCENGHQGNRYLNSARNLGRKCQQGFERRESI